MRILLAEDEKNLNEVIRKQLVRAGYAVDATFNGDEALDYLLSSTYDIVILDIMMPKKDGLEVLREYREAGNTTPVLFLTARDSIDDRVNGLDSGADDYLVKPFAFDELLARIRVLTRRRNSSSADNILRLDDLELDSAKHTVKRGGRNIDLSSREFALLEYMLVNAGIVLDREKLISHVWSYDYEGDSNLIDVYIRYLRRKIDDDYPVKLIHTVRGAGYVMRVAD